MVSDRLAKNLALSVFLLWVGFVLGMGVGAGLRDETPPASPQPAWQASFECWLEYGEPHFECVLIGG